MEEEEAQSVLIDPDNGGIDELSQLGADVYDQNELEEGVMRRLQDEMDRRDQLLARKRTEKSLIDLGRQIRQKRIVLSGTKNTSAERKKIVKDLHLLLAKEKRLNKKLQSGQPINELDSASGEEDDEENPVTSFADALSKVEKNNLSCAAGKAAKTSQAAAREKREELIRLGHMTPFGTSLADPSPGERSVMSVGVTTSAPSGHAADFSPRGGVSPLSGSPSPAAAGSGSASSSSSPGAYRAGLGKRPSPGRERGSVKPGARQPVARTKPTASACSTAMAGEEGEGYVGLPAARNRSRKKGSRQTSDSEEDEYAPSSREMRESFVDPESGNSSQAEQEDGGAAKRLPKKDRSKSAPVEGSSCRYSKSGKLIVKKKTACRDDGDEKLFEQRLELISAEQERQQRIVCRREEAAENGLDDSFDDGMDACGLPSWLKRPLCLESSSNGGNVPDDHHLPGGLNVPGFIWDRLYTYQRVGVQWLWELHTQQVGGIVGDEMGLGKTIQTIAFLAALHHSKTPITVAGRRYYGLGPVLIVCPATLLHQWVAEFHYWYPLVRVAVLHETGTFNGRKERLVRQILSGSGVLLTTYNGVRIHADMLLPGAWSYVFLDEGHKIRNPNAAITVTCKQVKTCHRIILSGSPMQNNLRELWSVFDFVFPGRLGNLPVFMTEFAMPITQGGYGTASTQQVQTAYKCACVLRDTINPYLLRRVKADVKSNLGLPPKTEQVLFCRLTTEQRKAYKQYLKSRDVNAILAGDMKVFAGLITLSKICNHPDLSSSDSWDPDATVGLKSIRCGYALPTASPAKAAATSVAAGRATELIGNGDIMTGSLDLARQDIGGSASAVAVSTVRTAPGTPVKDGRSLKESITELSYGYWKRSGKLLVVHSLLKMWYQQSHRALIFAQTKQTLDILERYVAMRGYKYMRMDGDTAVPRRQPLVNSFNNDRSFFVFLLTTRVGGLGINLVGADRVVIFDPDWNPSTDMQARERAWRIGQKRQVTVYRLLTTGTIEEKIYHRQIFKQFLTNRILKDPRQRRFFKANDLHELFTLNDEIGFAKTLKSSSADQLSGSTKDGSKALPLTETAAIFAGLGADVPMPKKRKVPMPSDDGGDEQVDSDADTEHVADGSPQAKKRRKKRNDTAIEGHRIRHLDCIDVEKKSRMQAADEDSTAMPTSSSKSSSPNTKLKKTSKANTSGAAAEDVAGGQPDDDFILRSLFKKSGILGALQHDCIMESSDADYALVQAEADRVARQASEQLAKSRQEYHAQSQPSWQNPPSSGKPKKLKFGKQNQAASLFVKADADPDSSGAGSVPPPQVMESGTGSCAAGQVAVAAAAAATTGTIKFGSGRLAGSSTVSDGAAPPATVHSSSLLARMQARRNHSAGGSVCDNVTAAPSNATAAQQAIGEAPASPILSHSELVHEMQVFIASQGDRITASSQALLAHFSTRLPQNGATIFRSMLRQICDFTRSSSGEGMWTLKLDFR